MPSFTGQLAVEARQPDGKGLQGTQWVVVIQGEHVILHASKLHDDVVGWGREAGGVSGDPVDMLREN